MKFSKIHDVNRKENLLEILEKHPELDIHPDDLIQLNEQAIAHKKTEMLEKRIQVTFSDQDDFDRYFLIEITPIFSRDDYLGTIILFKDITQNKKDLETIRANQEVMMEQERMASLGQLIGGIAHNLKTPIMSISGGIEGLHDLVEEYRSSIGDPGVDERDHQEIAKEMDEWLKKMKPYCSYMSDIITTVKGQAAQFNARDYVSFTMNEVLKRVELLMKHELNKYHCELVTDIHLDPETEILGEVNSLVQIFDNLIMNSIHSYEGKRGVIELKAFWDKDKIHFVIKDYGKGIRASIQDKLFRTMVTTKGKEGTGLGLYMSHATIRGHFKGSMWFESEENLGTTFHITIPSHHT